MSDSFLLLAKIKREGSRPLLTAPSYVHVPSPLQVKWLKTEKIHIINDRIIKQQREFLQLFRCGTIKHSQVTVPVLPYKMVECSSGAAEPRPLYRLILMPILDPI